MHRTGRVHREHDILLLIETVSCLVWNSVGKIISKILKRKKEIFV